ncbi:MAG: hypothetical protein RIQ47_90 [Bacteroidota bacterium]|jgi:hypothetical protein
MAPIFQLARFIVMLFAFSIATLSALGQQLQFCEKVDRNGSAIKPSTYFIIPPSGGTVQALITLPNPLAINEATIDIYRLSLQGKEQFESSIKIPVQQDWLWFAQPLKFYKKGNYVVYVYGNKSQLLGVGKIGIDLR